MRSGQPPAAAEMTIAEEDWTAADFTWAHLDGFVDSGAAWRRTLG